MTAQALIIWLIVGGVAGWLAGMIMKRSIRITGNVIVDNVIVGIVGAVIGGWLLGVLKVPIPGGDIVSAIIAAVIGAVILIFVAGLLRR